jgi:hypothetical protein
MGAMPCPSCRWMEGGEEMEQIVYVVVKVRVTSETKNVARQVIDECDYSFNDPIEGRIVDTEVIDILDEWRG